MFVSLVLHLINMALGDHSLIIDEIELIFEFNLIDYLENKFFD